jgi:hypothetical protein
MANAAFQSTVKPAFQTQQIRDIRQRLKLLEKIERDVDIIIRKQTLVFASLLLPHSIHRSTKNGLGCKRR